MSVTVINILSIAIFLVLLDVVFMLHKYLHKKYFKYINKQKEKQEEYKYPYAIPVSFLVGGIIGFFYSTHESIPLAVKDMVLFSFLVSLIYLNVVIVISRIQKSIVKYKKIIKNRHKNK